MYLDCMGAPWGGLGRGEGQGMGAALLHWLRAMVAWWRGEATGMAVHGRSGEFGQRVLCTVLARA